MPSIKDQSTVEAIAREFCSNGRDKAQGMRTIGYAESSCKSGKAVKDVYGNLRVQAAIARIDAKTAQKLQITRETQLTDLEEAKQMARDLKMPAAFVSACREQDNILGLIRDKAPNTEKVDEMLQRMSAEELAYRRAYAKQRTEAESESKPLFPRANTGAGGATLDIKPIRLGRQEG